MLDSVEATTRLLAAHDYIADVGLGTSIFLALRMNKALFLEGEPGVGKTEVAKVLSRAFAAPLIRLQCYEGLDINQAVYEWNYPRQLLEIQARQRQNGQQSDTADIFTERFLLKRPLLQAIDQSHDKAPVLLIDELDRADKFGVRRLASVRHPAEAEPAEVSTELEHVCREVLASTPNAPEQREVRNGPELRLGREEPHSARDQGDASRHPERELGLPLHGSPPPGHSAAASVRPSTPPMAAMVPALRKISGA